MKDVFKKITVFITVFVMAFSNSAFIIHAEETYQYSDSKTSGNVTLKVEWNEPVLGQETTFHVSASGGSGNYKFRMDAPSYSNPDETSYAGVADSSRGEWNNYTSICSSQDYTFTMMATGTYNFRFYLMDEAAGIYYMRTNTYISVSDSNYPSINTIVNNVVSQYKTDSEYQTALNLHDWLIDQMEYDNSLNWSSTESALTRHIGTCQSYTNAYAKLLNAAGIENSETRDTADGHTWNAVKLDGEWYQIDCTWDDSESNYLYSNQIYISQRHLYFGLTDELMAYAHAGHANIYTVSGYGTRSTSLADNYYVKNGEANTLAETYRDRIQAQLDSKAKSFTITADNASSPPSIYGIINGLVAYAINQMSWKSGDDYVKLTATGDVTQFTFSAEYYDSTHTHEYGDGVVTTQPTCSTVGIKTFTCSICGNTYTEEISKLEHSYEWRTETNATCTSNGLRREYCSRCGATRGTQTINATGHSWSSWVTVQNATTSSNGKQRRTCSRCGTSEEKTISKLATVQMYRLYNPNSGEHFYTGSIDEKNNLTRLGWRYEGVGWTAPQVSGYPVYRMYNKNAGEHHYTMSTVERDNLVRAGWKYEGIGWYSAEPNGVDSIQVKREYNPNAFANNHNYTASVNEHNWLVSLGWRDEGTGWYAVK